MGEAETLKLWIAIIQKKPMHTAFIRLEPHVRNCSNNLLLINSCVNCKIDISFFYSGIFIHMLKMIIVYMYNGLWQCAFAGSKEHNAFKKVHNIDQ